MMRLFGETISTPTSPGPDARLWCGWAWSCDLYAALAIDTIPALRVMSASTAASTLSEVSRRRCLPTAAQMPSVGTAGNSLDRGELYPFIRTGRSKQERFICMRLHEASKLQVAAEG